MKRTCMVTVDAEALPNRATGNHVEGLLWGSFGESDEYGVGRMVEEGHRYGVPITFYLDFAEQYLYGADFTRVASFLAKSSHDLQLHLHPEILPDSFWEANALTKPKMRRFAYPRELCFCLMDKFVANFTAVAGSSPIAFRAGAFQASNHWLDAAARHMAVSSNHCYSSWVNQKRTPWAGPEAGPFVWSSGLIELPVSQIFFEGDWQTLSLPFRSQTNILGDIVAQLPNDGDLPPLVLLLHSWSLLQYVPNSKQFRGGADWKVDVFRQVLEIISARFDPISTVEFVRRSQAGQLPRMAVRSYP